jgi:hypothetical protein
MVFVGLVAFRQELKIRTMYQKKEQSYKAESGTAGN